MPAVTLISIHIYNDIRLDAPIRYRGGVTVFYQPSPRYVVEAIQKFRPNVIGFHLETGEIQWYIIGCYLAPDDTLTIESVVAAIKERLWGAELLVAGYLNINLEDPDGYQREEEIAASFTMAGIEDMPDHVLL